MTRRIKILHMINELEMGGAPRLVTDLATRLSNREDMEIGVLTFREAKNDHLHQIIKSNPRITLYELPTRNPFSPRFINRIKKICTDYDIIHAHLFPTGYIAALANIRTGKPLVYTEHSTHNRRRNIKMLRPIEKNIYSRFSTITAISAQVGESLGNWLTSDKLKNKIRTIENGVVLDRFTTSATVDPEKLFGRKGRPIIMISRFTGSKDHATLIQALPMLKNKDLYAVFVGEGPTQEACREIASHAGVKDKCLFLGTRHDIPELIHASFIGVQSSHWEGFGLTAIEIMATGKPLIASDVPGLANVVEGAGLLFPHSDSEALARNIDNLASNPEEYAAVAKMCRQRASEFNISHTVDKFSELYHQLMNPKTI